MTRPKPLLVLLFALALTSFTTSQIFAQAIDNDPMPSPDDFVDVSEEPVPLVPIEQLIKYPEGAKKAGLEDKVVAQVLIGKDGSVEKVQILKAGDEMFRQAAIDAFNKSRWTPAKQNGKAVRIWIVRTINFKLMGASDPTSKPLTGPPLQLGWPRETTLAYLRSHGSVVTSKPLDPETVLYTATDFEYRGRKTVATAIVDQYLEEYSLQDQEKESYEQAKEHFTQLDQSETGVKIDRRVDQEDMLLREFTQEGQKLQIVWRAGEGFISMTVSRNGYVHPH